MEPLFSIVTATYNAGVKLVPTIESVLSQDRELFEYIVVDGGSTDETLSAAGRFGPQLRVVSEPDRGVYDALNKGVALATGRYIYFLGAGDRLRPGVLARVAPLLPSGPALVYGNAWFRTQQRVYNGRFTKRDLVVRNVCHQSAFYERSLFTLLGPFDLRYRLAADWVFNIRCFGDPRVRVEYIDEIVADYEGGGMSDQAHDAVFLRDMPRLVRQTLGWPAFLWYMQYAARVKLSRLKKGVAQRLSGS